WAYVAHVSSTKRTSPPSSIHQRPEASTRSRASRSSWPCRGHEGNGRLTAGAAPVRAIRDILGHKPQARSFVRRDVGCCALWTPSCATVCLVAPFGNPPVRWL